MPWCPKCGYEYKSGYTKCSDCNVDLVDSLDGIQNEQSEEENAPSLSQEDLIEEFNKLTDEEKEEFRKNATKKTEIYVECGTRAKEYKSGAVTLLVVGIVGAIALILFDLGVINISFGASKILISIVMGFLFLVFIIMGIASYNSYLRLKDTAKTEEKNIKDILEFFNTQVDKCTIQIEESSDISFEEACLRQYESIKEIISANFEDLQPDFLDYITEKVYEKMFD